MGGTHGTNGGRERERETRNAHRMLIRKSEGNRKFGRPRHRKERNIKTDLIEIDCEDV
jgi:hypothetical protein